MFDDKEIAMISRKMYLNNLMGQELKAYGFKRRGSACFRVIGDGILQVVKFQKERCGGEFHLYVGLFSMYDSLKPEWFTSWGCIPRYTVMLFVGRRDPLLIQYQNGLRIDTFTAPEEQLAILIEKGIPWLNEIVTQAQLVDGMCHLEMIDRKKIYWLDKEKIIPFMKSNRKKEAIRVISSILQQNVGLTWWELPVWEDSEFRDYEKNHPNPNEELLFLYHLITDENESNIQKYYEENYKRNMKHAAFCMK